jgi:hypothetical protein
VTPRPAVGATRPGAARLARSLVVLTVALGVGLLAPGGALACSCVPQSDREKLKEADAAFVGRLVAVREVDPPAEGEPIGSADPVDFVYRVGRIYKGGGHGINTVRRVRVRSARNGASCGLDDRIGRLVGLFVYRQNHRWHSNSCLTTTPRKLRRAARASTASRAGSPGSAGCG